MVKEKKHSKTQKNSFFSVLCFLIGVFFALLLLAIVAIYRFESKYRQMIYPGIRVDNVTFGGKKPEEVEKYYAKKSLHFNNLSIVFKFEDKIASLSGEELAISYDGKLSAAQAYSLGRSGNIFSDTYLKWRGATLGINLSSMLKINTEILEETLDRLASSIEYPSQDALFQFENGKVSLFRLSKIGLELDKKTTKQMVYSYINSINDTDPDTKKEFIINLPVNEINPKIKTEDSNDFGVKELIASGKSRFVGSIPGRVHNIQLAALKLNGRLIEPGATFSFNDAIGDISFATGFQPAYIIKDGRTVLGDGGGVCQVSTTLFRAALNAGLPIVERHAHAYRVSYYEQDSPPGLDATVFAPSYDLKFKNDTVNYILIQSRTDVQNSSLVFELYGTKDGRSVEISKPAIYSQTPPPSPLYQDDPTLAKGITKQVDWSASGAKVNFDYKVTKENQTLSEQSFFSNFRAWQAVYLRGTKE